LHLKIKKYTEDFLFSDTLSATVTKFLLMLIAMGGITIIGANLPGLVKAVRSFNKIFQKFQNKFPKKKIAKALSYLKHKKLVEIVEVKNGKTTVRLTNKGEKRLAEYSLETLKIERPERWDGKWRVLIFDIPAHPRRYNSARNALRNKVKELGFYQIQKSVWTYPYDCEDELLYISEIFNVQNYIEIMTVERLLHEKSVRKHFPFL